MIAQAAQIMQAAAYSTVITGEVKMGIFSSAVNLQPQTSSDDV